MGPKRSVTVGKVRPYVDVKKESQIPELEAMLSSGPTIVLIYADWCGHCQTFKQAMWDECANSSNKTMNAAAVHFDMVDKTSLKSAPVEGYPTLFEVKASPKTTPPKAIATPREKEELVALLNGKKTVVAANATTFAPEEPESLPPNRSLDLKSEELPVSKQQGGSQQGGSLMHSLVKFVGESAHVALLASSAMELSRRLKRRATKKQRSSGKKTLRRRR